MRGDGAVSEREMPAGLALPANEAPFLLLREQPDQGVRHQDDAADAGEDREPSGLYCRACGLRITGQDRRIAVNGSHAHTFFNPAGRVFEVGCFSQAPGCLVSPEASLDFTWFAGYAWRPAVCSGCAVHLGWLFEKGDAEFFSLILPSLTDRRR